MRTSNRTRPRSSATPTPTLATATEPDSDAGTEVEGKSAVIGADEDFERKLVFAAVHPS